MQVEDLGLSAVPHWGPVQRFDPAQQMQLIVIASDGVWDVASADRVVQVCVHACALWCVSASTCQHLPVFTSHARPRQPESGHAR